MVSTACLIIKGNVDQSIFICICEIKNKNIDFYQEIDILIIFFAHKLVIELL